MNHAWRSISFAAVVCSAVVCSALAQQPPAATLGELREAARLIPGRRPLRINVVKFAESRRTKNFSIKGAPAEPSIQARTAYQVVYADGTVMIDSGMDQQVHKFFGRGVEEPYDAEAAKQVEQAVRAGQADRDDPRAWRSRRGRDPDALRE